VAANAVARAQRRRHASFVSIADTLGGAPAMPIRYEILPNLVRLEISGVMDAAEIFAFYDAIAKDPKHRPGTAMLVDARNVTDAAPFHALEGAAREATRSPVFSTPTKAAALVASTWMFGIVRQWAAMSSDSPLVTRPFYNETEALSWLADPVDIRDS
jgi:hypothetical protein